MDSDESKIIGIGEFSHGTKEVTKLKVELIKVLIKDLGFNVIALESNMAMTEEINRYIIKREGTLDDVINFIVPYMNTPEFKSLIAWLYDFNLGNLDKVRVFGLDMQNPQYALRKIKEYARNSKLKDLEVEIEKFENIYRRNIPNESLPVGWDNDLIKISTNISMHFDTIDNESALLLNSRLLNQFSQLNALTVAGASYNERFNLRDSAMFNNIMALNSKYQDDKIIVWAHNDHVRESYNGYKPLGFHLSREFGNNYKSLGFGSSTGYYTAVDEKKNKISFTNELQKPVKKSYEYVFDQINKDAYILDLNSDLLDVETRKWLEDIHSFRLIGFSVQRKQFVSHLSLSDSFDYLIYIKSTNSSDLNFIK
jgi:erythromycin esterase